MSKTPEQLFQDRITETIGEIVKPDDPAFKAAVAKVMAKKQKPAKKPPERRKLKS